MILVSGSTATMKRLVEPNLGILLTPKNRNSVVSVVATGLPWAIDNGAFSGFDPIRFRWLLERAAGLPGLMWVVCPDVVADAAATLVKFEEWEPILRIAGVPIAFVGQDGQESSSVPWDRFECFFIGGSTAFKLGDDAAHLVAEAKGRGKWVHMGRVNSYRRLAYAVEIGCDSVDGSSMSMFGDRYIAKFCRWARRLKTRGRLF